MIDTKPTLLVLLGSTGIGKTELSIDLALNYGTEIVSCDSRQFYKEIPIGTAAPSPQQLIQCPHHFIGQRSIFDTYNAGQYELDALEKIEKLFEQHSYVVLTGGSMMYLDAICKGIDNIPAIDPQLRIDLTQRFEKEGLDNLLQELKILDPEYYQKVDTKNHKRVIHGLEVCLMTGCTYSSFRSSQTKKRPFQIIKIGLQRDREKLYERINQRVDIMMEEGLLEEAQSLLEHKNLNALNTVGYKELFRYLEGEWSLDFAIDKIKQNSRIYSRKQMTWFRRDPNITWFHPDQKEAIHLYIQSHSLCK